MPEARAIEVVQRLSLELYQPIECKVGEDCYIQNYVDGDPGPGDRDFTGGFLTYDDHSGVDFALESSKAMREGVSVVAAADGEVQSVRNNMRDVDLFRPAPYSIEDRECGNGVVIDHGDGWETQYCHMQRGSIVVEPGDEVNQGQDLGLVGLSGHTEFAHLHLTVRYQGETVDPYVGLTSQGDSSQTNPLWAEDVASALAYRSSGIISSGFTNTTPEFLEIREGYHSNSHLHQDAQMIIFWTSVYGLQQGDVQVMRIISPRNGEVLSERRTEPAPKDKVTSFIYTGKRLRTDHWPRGRYVGEYQLIREGEVVAEVRKKIRVRR